MDLRTRYVVKGIQKEQIIDSKVNIYYNKESGRITKVEDKWDGTLPDSSFKNVSLDQLVNPYWWLHYGEAWLFWGWSFTWNTFWWQASVEMRGNLLVAQQLTLFDLGFPKTQLCDSAKDGQCSKE